MYRAAVTAAHGLPEKLEDLATDGHTFEQAGEYRPRAEAIRALATRARNDRELSIGDLAELWETSLAQAFAEYDL